MTSLGLERVAARSDGERCEAVPICGRRLERQRRRGTCRARCPPTIPRASIEPLCESRL